MNIQYHTFRGLIIQFEAQDIIEGLKTLEFVQELLSGEVAKAKLQYFIDICEAEIGTGEQ